MNSPLRPSTRRSVMAAVVLGTALSALSSSAQAATSDKAVSDISRYCTTCWRNARLHPDYWGDCTQDVFTRLMERLQPASWERVMLAEGEERKEFLRAIDAVKKRTQRARKGAPLTDEGPADLRASLRDERAAVDQAAANLLSDRQQEIVRKSFDGWSVHEIADDLKLPAERISDEKYKAIRKLREKLSEN